MGLGGFEPPTSPLSGVRSNQLSYRPEVLIHHSNSETIYVKARLSSFPFYLKGGDPAPASARATLLRLHPSHEPQSGKRPPKLGYLLLLQSTPMV